MQTNFIYFTDPHLRGNNPISRKDNFPETAFKKLAWVVDCANELDAALVCGGDWVQRPDTAPHIISQIQRILARAKNPIFTVLGNHDVYGANPGTFFRTPLHIIEVAGTLTRLSAEPEIWRGVQLTGVDAHFDLDQQGRTIDYTEVNRDSGLPAIHVVHGFLTDHLWPNVPCTLIQAVSHTQADLVLTGHEHSGFGVQTAHNGKIFCNPGALLRVTAAVGDVNQTVKVALISVQDGQIKVMLMPLPPDIARPASEVLDRERLVMEREAEQRNAEFYASLENFTLDPGKNAFQLLQDYADSQQLAPVLVEKLRLRLEAADLELARIKRKEQEDA